MNNHICHAFLKQRQILWLEGENIENFLQGITTNDMRNLCENKTLWTGFLTPQGKYLFDALVFRVGHRIALDHDSSQTEGLKNYILKYRLRVKCDVTIAEDMLCLALWGDSIDMTSYADSICLQDSRHPDLGWRIWAPSPKPLSGSVMSDYRQWRLQTSICEAAEDLGGNAQPFWLELQASSQDIGVSFQKGCFIGQEVTARMHHRNAVRKGIIIQNTKAMLPDGMTALQSYGDYQIAYGRKR